MRVMLKVHMPVEAANAALRDGRMPKTFQRFTEKFHPEASYFFAENGRRTALFVFDMKDASDMPAIAEPFFMNLNATVDAHPVMNADDLKKGLEKVMKELQPVGA